MIRLLLGVDSIDAAPCGTLVVGIYQGERPPRGEAGWVDWRLGGAISRAIAAGRIDGAAGSTVLMPAQKLPCARIILVGMGTPAEFKGRALGIALDSVLVKLAGLKETDFAIALPGTKLVPPPRDAAEVIGAQLLGTLATNARSAKITLLGPPELKAEIREWVRAQGDPVASHVVLEDGAGPPAREQGAST